MYQEETDPDTKITEGDMEKPSSKIERIVKKNKPGLSIWRRRKGKEGYYISISISFYATSLS